MADETDRDEAAGGHPAGKSPPQSDASRPALHGKRPVKRPYSPPQLKSLGKVADMTFGHPTGSARDGLGRKSKTA
jgi:hypothetical protein